MTNLNARVTKSARHFIRVGSLAIALLFAAGSANAMGFGAYFDYGHNWGSFDSILACSGGSCISQDINESWDRDNWSFGFLLDTAVAKDTLFNYRLNAGYQRTIEKLPNRGGAQQNLNGLMLRNIFGFGVVRTENMRFFLGPVLRLGFQFPDDQGYLSGADVYDIDAGGGLALGLNYHLGDSLTLTISPVYEYLASVRFPSNLEASLIGGGHVLSINMGVMFRSKGDRFNRE